MSSDNIKAIIETTLKTEILKALNSVPEAIEALVKCAIEQEVYAETGTTQGPQYARYDAKKMPYLDYLVGKQIRFAAEQAVREAVKVQEPAINAEVAKRISAQSVVEAFTKEIVNTVGQSWKINVSFESDKNS